MSHIPALNSQVAETSAFVFNLADVATALGVSPGHFRNIRRELEARGFPKALPVLTGRWSRAAVIAWIEDNGQNSHNGHLARRTASDTEIEAAVEAIERRYTKGAA